MEKIARDTQLPQIDKTPTATSEHLTLSRKVTLRSYQKINKKLILALARFAVRQQHLANQLLATLNSSNEISEQLKALNKCAIMEMMTE